jgi:hypothetical protein
MHVFIENFLGTLPDLKLGNLNKIRVPFRVEKDHEPGRVGRVAHFGEK